MLFYLRTSPTTRRCSRVQAINSQKTTTTPHELSYWPKTKLVRKRWRWKKSLWCRRGGLEISRCRAILGRKPHDVCHATPRYHRKPTTCAMLRFRMLLYVHRTPSGAAKSISSEDPIRLPYRATMSFQSIWY